MLKTGVPSPQLLFLGDNIVNCSETLGVNTRQWNKRYECSDFCSPKFNFSLEFDSYIIPAKGKIPAQIWLLDTGNRPVTPYLVQSRILITRVDVFHSLTVLD